MSNKETANHWIEICFYDIRSLINKLLLFRTWCYNKTFKYFPLTKTDSR